MTSRSLVSWMIGVRIAIGAAAVLAPGPSSRLFGFPREQDSPSARLMGRLFGVRDIALGVLVWRTRDEPQLERWVYALNAAVDASDAASMATAVVRREGIDRAAASSAVPAVTAAVLWTSLARRGR